MSDIQIGSVWHDTFNNRLAVVTAYGAGWAGDNSRGWVATRYLRDNFPHNSEQDLEQFLKWHKLIYSPSENDELLDTPSPSESQPAVAKPVRTLPSQVHALVNKVIHEAFLLGYNNAKRSGCWYSKGDNIPIQSKKQLLTELEDSYQSAPVIDDTFNDDAVVQASGDIKWDTGATTETDEKSRTILVTVCSKCGSTVPIDSVLSRSRWAARLLKAWKLSEVGK